MRRRQNALVLCSLLFAASVMAQQTGVRMIGRWLPGNAPTATYAGSTIVLGFKHSSTVSADFKVLNTKAQQPLFVSVSIDGGKAVRVALSRGAHPGLILAQGLSDGAHVVTVRKEGEPSFGALQFSNPLLDVAGRWLPVDEDRPVIEVIGDSDATGICALGPDSPEDAVSIWNPEWAAESLSWVGVLESELAAVGHPADLVDLALSGSKTGSEADTYDYVAPGFSDARFGEYLPPSRKHASLVLLWGGGNDRHGGGDVARSKPVTYANLSAFQKGVYDQLSKIFARNPAVKVALLAYIDPTLPEWEPAYDEVRSLFTAEQRSRMFFLRIHVPKGKQDACEIDPKGHPNVSLHATWAGQILEWMMSPEVFGALDFPGGEHWGDL